MHTHHAQAANNQIANLEEEDSTMFGALMTKSKLDKKSVRAYGKEMLKRRHSTNYKKPVVFRNPYTGKRLKTRKNCVPTHHNVYQMRKEMEAKRATEALAAGDIDSSDDAANNSNEDVSTEDSLDGEEGLPDEAVPSSVEGDVFATTPAAATKTGAQPGRAAPKEPTLEELTQRLANAQGQLQAIVSSEDEEPANSAAALGLAVGGGHEISAKGSANASLFLSEDDDDTDGGRAATAPKSGKRRRIDKRAKRTGKKKSRAVSAGNDMFPHNVAASSTSVGAADSASSVGSAGSNDSSMSPCLGLCGFYGSPATDGYCSKCFRAFNGDSTSETATTPDKATAAATWSETWSTQGRSAGRRKKAVRYLQPGQTSFVCCGQSDVRALMVKCDTCGQWNHGSCVGLQITPSGPWACSLCNPAPRVRNMKEEHRDLAPGGTTTKAAQAAVAGPAYEHDELDADPDAAFGVYGDVSSDDDDDDDEFKVTETVDSPTEDELEDELEDEAVHTPRKKRSSKAQKIRKPTARRSSSAGFVVDDEASAKSKGKRPASARRKSKASQPVPKAVRQTFDDGDTMHYKQRISAWRQQVAQTMAVNAAKADAGELGEATEDEVLNVVLDTHAFHDWGQLPQDIVLGGGYRMPGLIWERLHEFQRESVRYLHDLHRQGVGGIIGDEMGLGKTVQVISFLAGLHYGQSRSLDYDNGHVGAMPTSRHVSSPLNGAILVVCPATVLHQWVAEFHKWWPPFRVAVLHNSGSYKGSRDIVDMVANAGVGNVLVTTYSAVRLQQVRILKHKWHYVVLDEGHKIRNPDAEITLVAKQLQTPHRIILSGSPIQNNLKELWSLFDFIFPGKLGTLPVFKNEYQVPMTQGSYSDATDMEVQIAYECAVSLRDTITPYLLRRNKKDLNDQIKLPGRTEQVLFCKLTPDQRALYKSYVDSPEVKSICRDRRDTKTFVAISNLRKICNHPDLATDLCSPPDYSNPLVPGPCERSGKMKVLKQLLELWKANDHRVLIFSQTRQMLTLIESFVQSEEYTYLRMDGNTTVKSRQPMVARFNTDKGVFLFLLTTKVGGLGINLTGADRVIIFDPDWNPSTDLQARERAWRIGQRKDVTIYRLLITGTIEEKIYHRQIFKQLLSKRVLQDPKQRRFFKSNDLYDLFKLGDEEDTDATETSAVLSGTNYKVRGKSQSGQSDTLKQSRDPRGKGKGKGRKSKKSERRDIKGLALVDRVEKMKQPVADDEEEAAKDSNGDKDYVLNSLFKGSSVHSAVRHDAALESGPSDHVLVEREAREVARKAKARLQESEKQCGSLSIGTPVWTGRFGVAGTPRFGAVASARAGAVKLGAGRIGGASAGLRRNKAQTSSALLSKIRERKGTGKDADPIASASKDFSMGLLRDIRDFLKSEGGQVTTADIMRRFSAKIGADQQALFKALLQTICKLHKRSNGEPSVWRLRPR